MSIRLVVVSGFLFVLGAGVAHARVGPGIIAYVGPGISAGAIGVVLGILGSICIGLFAIVYYPIKRWFKKVNRSNAGAKDFDSEKSDSRQSTDI